MADSHGLDGVDGLDGLDGLDGPDGPDGPDRPNRLEGLDRLDALESLGYLDSAARPGAERTEHRAGRSPAPADRESLTERLERAVLGGARRYTRLEVEQLTGVARERTERLWRALGFADADDDDVVFTDADVTALKMMDGLVDSGFIDPTIEAAAARSTAQALARLAEWEVGLVNDFIVAQGEDEQADTDGTTLLRFAESVLPLMEQLHSYVWRRHLAAFTGRFLAAWTDDPASDAVVVGFADVVGYTRLSRDLSETDLARLIEHFDSMAADVIAAAGGRVVKTLGDEVLFVADDPVAAATIGLRLLDGIEADPDLPDLRIGLARGKVLSRFGDVYGPVVNIASRLTSSAKPGTVLIDRELAAALADEPGFRLRRRRPRAVRGYSNLSSWRLTRAAPPPPAPPAAPAAPAAPAPVGPPAPPDAP